MARWKSRRWFGLPLFWQVAWLLSISASSLAAQELPFKRDVPGSTPYQCPPLGAAPTPDAAARARARRIGATAAQAVILGDLQRAASLLEQATELDPSSADLAYHYARVLEDSGGRAAAISQYCRALELAPNGVEESDARERLDALVAAARPAIPDAAITAFRTGLAQADSGRLERAADSFDSAAASAPRWAEAVYDEGVAEARLGRTSEAIRDLRKYLELRPDAPDAIAVSGRIGALQSLQFVSVPSPVAALALGLLIPGMGQFYSGRALGGLAVLSVAGGAVAAGLLIKKTTVRCLSTPGPGGTCPPGEVLSTGVRHPYRTPAFAVAAAVSTIGAIEAFMNLRRRRSASEALASIDLGSVKLGMLDAAASANGLDLRWVHLVF